MATFLQLKKKRTVMPDNDEDIENVKDFQRKRKSVSETDDSSEKTPDEVHLSDNENGERKEITQDLYASPTEISKEVTNIV